MAELFHNSGSRLQPDRKRKGYGREESVLQIHWLLAEGGIVGFHIHGHAGRVESGANIVCAAVSAIAQCTVMGIMDVAGVKPGECSMEDGDMRFLLPESMTAEEGKASSLLLETMKIGLDSIALDHSDIIAIYTDAQDK